MLDHDIDQMLKASCGVGDYWLKAIENLEMTAVALANKKYNVCASRAYYGVFLASIAALIKLTEVRPRTANGNTVRCKRS